MAELKEIITEKYNTAQSLGAVVEVIGSWVWAEFKTIPSPEVRTKLKAEGFKWNLKRKLWQYAGIPSKGNSKTPKELLKYKWGCFQIATPETDKSNGVVVI